MATWGNTAAILADAILGGTLLDSAEVLRIAGANAAPIPLAETAMLGGWLLAEAGLELPEGPVSVVPGLAGSAAAVAGLMQQLMGALAGFAVGLLPLDGALYLGWLMLGFSLLAAAAQVALHRHRTQKPSPTVARSE